MMGYSLPMLAPSDIAPDTPRPIRRTEYERMVELGMFEGERVELLEGMIVQMSPHGPEHDSALERLNEILVKALTPRASVRVQSAFAANDGSEPEPDLAVVPRRDWSKQHPTEAHLVVEVAKSSLAKDRGVKAPLFASSGVPEYWIVNLVDRIIEVHAEPVRGAYTRVTPYRRGERVPIVSFPDVAIDVDAIIP